MKIVIAGSSGFLGSSLTSEFEKEGHGLVLLSRNSSSPTTHYWNPEMGELDPLLLEDTDVVINLAGENIFGRWNKAKMERIRQSRMDATQLLCKTIMALNVPPKIYLGASAIGYYGDRGEEILDESSSPGKNFFLAEVCERWEQIPKILNAEKIRVVHARLGMVLGKGGALQHISKAFHTGMGGVLGSGKQMISWIAIDDVCGAMKHIIEHDELAGPVNFVAPQAVSNQQFTQTVGKVLNRPTSLSVPKFALNMLFGEGAEMFLASTHVYPKRLLESGYQFRYPELEPPLKKYLS